MTLLKQDSRQKPLVAVTGGIGSGKSYVCRLLTEQYGIRVYDCDTAARRLMNGSEPLKQALRALAGPQVYSPDGQLQKPVLAQFLLDSDQNRQRVNDVVHPAVAADFLQSGYTWLESAVLFGSGFCNRVPFTHVVCVTAPDNIRIERIMKRNAVSREKARAWIACQLPQDEVARLSTCCIVNDGKADLDRQIRHALERIRQR